MPGFILTMFLIVALLASSLDAYQQKRDGSPDYRYSENRHFNSDGSWDMRYSTNRGRGPRLY